MESTLTTTIPDGMCFRGGRKVPRNVHKENINEILNNLGSPQAIIVRHYTDRKSGVYKNGDVLFLYDLENNVFIRDVHVYKEKIVAGSTWWVNKNTGEASDASSIRGENFPLPVGFDFKGLVRITDTLKFCEYFDCVSGRKVEKRFNAAEALSFVKS